MSLIIEAFYVLVLTLLNKALCHSLGAVLHHAVLAAQKQIFPSGADASLSGSCKKKRDQPHSEEAFGKIPICYLRMTFDKIGGRCDLILYPSSSFKEKLILQLAIFFFLYSKGMWSLRSTSRSACRISRCHLHLLRAPRVNKEIRSSASAPPQYLSPF